MLKSTSARVVVMLCAAFAVAGCQQNINPNTYTASSTTQATQTFRGVVESARFVEVRNADQLQRNWQGGALGAVAGGVAGSLIGGGAGRVLAAGAGALAGAAVGAVAQDRLSRQTGIEYIVRTENGQLFTIVQGPEDQMAVGTPVFVQLSGERARVIRA